MKWQFLHQNWVKTGAMACLLFLTLEMAIDIVLSTSLPEYAWYRSSISQLGHGESPFASWVMVWGFCFFALLTTFALGFYRAYTRQAHSFWASLMIFIYALGEGLGSGLFPLDPPGADPTVSTLLHNVFSGVGDLGLIAFPFFLLWVFPRNTHLSFHKYLWWVISLGLTLLILFLLAKYAPPAAFITNLKGLWQRLYLLNYHLLFVVVALKMLRNL